jgi:hypothetical protein
MRIGITPKKQRVKEPKPVLQNANSTKLIEVKVGGAIISNLIDGIYLPKLTIITEIQAENFAEALLSYEESMSMNTNVNLTENGDELEAINVDNIFKPSEKSYLFASEESRAEFLTILSETSSHFTSTSRNVPKWKVYANAAKFERNLNEKYGRMRPIIDRYPGIEVKLRSLQRKYSRGDYSAFRKGDPPIDKKTSIIILFMMYRNGVRPEIVGLAVLFLLVGLQPWALVLLVTIGHYLLQSRKKKKLPGWHSDEVKNIKPYYADAVKNTSSDEASIKKAKHDILETPVGTPIRSSDFADQEIEGKEMYDTLVVGSGPDALYTAALLSKTGRSVLVLSKDTDASGCKSLELESASSEAMKKYENVPFDIENNNVAHTSRQQKLLAPVLQTETDAQGGIRFARIGSIADGFTTDILSIPGMGSDNYNESHPYLLHGGGASSISIDAATFLGDGWPSEDDGVGNSTSASYLNLCAGINATASQYYISHLLSEKGNRLQKASSYEESSIRYASGFLDQGLSLNAHVRSLMAGIGMKGENLPPSKTSMAVHVTNICAQASSEGFTYPVGGPRALCHALASVINQNGGKVLTGVDFGDFLFDEKESEEKKDDEKKEDTSEGTSESSKKPRCYGIKLRDGREISVGKHEDSCVISMLGFISTFIFHMPDQIRTKYGIPSGLPALAERRPLLHFMIGLRGSAEELNVTGADWYRLPNASLAFDEKEPETGTITPGVIGARVLNDQENDENNEIAADSSEDAQHNDTSNTRGKRSKVSKKSKKCKFYSGQSWMKISFPSAKDPSWTERHGKITTCVVTVEADDDFIHPFDSAPKIFSNRNFTQDDYQRLLDRVMKDVYANFPQLKDKVDFCSMTGPIRKGLSHTPLRYAAKGIRPKTIYPGLFVGGSDLTVGDSFSGSIVGGWMVANAVVNYGDIDYIYLDKNITNDLILFSKRCKANDEEDVAVPFKEALHDPNHIVWHDDEPPTED